MPKITQVGSQDKKNTDVKGIHDVGRVGTSRATGKNIPKPYEPVPARK